MEERTRAIGSARILWSLFLGLGLTLGLLWAMMPRSVVEAQAINPGFVAVPTRAAVLDQVASDDTTSVARTSATDPPVPAPPGDQRMPHGSLPGMPGGSSPSTSAPASARSSVGQVPGSGLSRADGAVEPDGSNNRSGAVAAATYPASTFSELHIRLEKNPDYYDAASVVVTQVTSLFIDADEAWSRYQSGELDTIAPPESALDTIKASPVYSPQLHTYPRQCTYYYGFSNDVPPFENNPDLRGAFASAIDRQRLISETGALSGDELPALTFTPPGTFGHVDGYAAGIGRPYSPTLAMDLLVASGYTGTPTITLMYNTSPGHQAIAEAVRQMWIDTLGITVTLQDMEWGSYLDLLSNGSAAERPGVFRLGWCADYPDAHNWLYEVFHSTGHNWARYNNPAYDALVEAATGETLSTTRLSLYEQAESYLVMTDTAIAPLYYFVGHRLTRPDLARTYRSFGGQHLDEWTVTSTPRPLEIAWGSPSTLDPALAVDTTSFNYVEQLFLGLTDVDEAGNALPELATSWDVSADASIYTFTMRSDVTWTNSISVVTAYDVEYGVLRSLDPGTGSGYAWVLYIIENAQEYNEGSITDPDLVGVEALDATHVRFTLESPAAYFPMIAGLPPARPQPRWAIETHGGAWTDPANIVTNGPYRLAHWDQMPYLRINKWGNGDPMAGSTFLFHVEYWNDGGAPVENSVITDTMLGGMTYISDTSPFTHTGSGSGPIVWHLGTLTAHSSGQFEVHVQVTAAPSQTITNKVQIATSNPDDQGEQWEKESEWSGHVEGPRMRVDYAHDFVGAVYPAGHTFWITVTDSTSTVKATASLSTTVDGAGHGYWGYDGFVTESGDWSPSQPDIQPDDRVHFQSDDGYTNTMRVGEITGELDVDADTVSGTINAPWFTQTLQGHAGAWGFTWEDFTVDPAGGSYFVHFSEDLQPDWSINVEYVEPDGDKVINIIQALDLVMNVNYAHDWAEGNYEAGHTLWITVTESDGFTVKATAVLTTGVIPWWGGQTGFSTNLGDPWVPDQPDIVPDDWVYGLVDNGYTTTVRMGTINGELDVDADTVSGTIHANWFTQMLNANCRVWEQNGPGRDFTVDPDGGSYFCDFGAMGWDLLPGHQVGVEYQEPDGDWVINVFREPTSHLRINKWADGNPGEGGNLAFRIQYQNEGDANAENTVITDTLLGGMTYITDTSGFPHTGSGSGPIVWDLGTVEPGDWIEFDVFVQVTAAQSDTITNTVQIGTSNPYDQGDPGEKYSEWWGHVEANDTHLNVGKGAWTGDPAPDTDFVYSVNVCNNGSTGSSQVTLSDTLHPSTTLQYWWGQHPGWTEVVSSSNLLVVSRPLIPGWWCGEVYLRVHLDAAAWPGMYITNTAVISASNDLEDDDNETFWDGHVNDPHTNLYINKHWGWGQLVPGGELDYNVDFGNNGNVPVASTIRITDTLPVSTTFNSAWLHGNQQMTFPITPTVVTGDYVVWEVNGVDNGYNVSFIVLLDVDNDAIPGTVLTNTVEISPQPDEDGYDDNVATVVETLYNHGPNLRVRKEAWWDSEEQIQYWIDFENIGTTRMENIWITDTYPISTTFNWDWWVYHGPWITVTHDAPDRQIIFWAQDLDPGNTASIGFRVDLDGSIHGVQGLTFTNTVAAPWPGDVHPADNSDVELAYTGPDVCIEKWLSGGIPRPGEVVTFTVEFGNRNNWWSGDDGYGSHITDTLPAEMEFITAVAPWDDDWMPNQLPGNVLVWDWGTMWSGHTWYFDIVAQITNTVGVGEVFTNVIEAYGDSPTDVEPFWDNNVFELGVTVAPGNTPPSLSGLPDQIFDHTTSLPGTIDLWAYAWDIQTPVSGLTYTIEGTPPTGAGVTLGSNQWLTINPSTDWCGWTDVTIRVTDPGGLWDSDTFRVAVTWSCKGPLPVANQYALQDEPITIDLTPYEPQVGDGTGLSWYVTGEDHCTVSGEYSADDVLTFTPDLGFVGSDTVTLHMVYPWGSEATQEITLTWGGGEAPPSGFRIYLPMVAKEYR